MKRLYSCTFFSVKKSQTEYSLRKEIPTIFKAYPCQRIDLKDLLFNIYWWIITKGNYCVWCAYDGDDVIHTSYVVPKCVKFPFLRKGSYEIGPCKTESAYRGKGIYPAVLTEIIMEVKTAYMIVDDNNTASIRGITKTGFVAMPGEIKRDKLKRFVYITEN